jgi:N-acetylglucosamine-6-sulfatase
VGRFLSASLVPLAALGVVAALRGGSGEDRAVAGWAAKPPPRPNVLVIETDDQTVESMRVMRGVNSLIGDRGATFKNSFVNYSLCCPSRATFLTGQYAHNHGVLGNEGPQGGFQRFQALHARNNLAVWLRRAGYHTALIGRYLNGYRNEPPVPAGWSEWHVPAPSALGVYGYTMNDDGLLVDHGHRRRDFLQDVLTSKAIELVERRAPGAQPFFLWLAYTSPHVAPDPNPNPPFGCQRGAKPAPRHAEAYRSEPLPSSPDFNEPDVSDKPAAIRALPRFDAGEISGIRRKYRCALGSLLSVDEGVRKVLRALRETDELANTLIVYTSDNGFHYGEHRIPPGKMGIYEASIRVPLQVRGPGIPQGVKANDLTTNADLAPTIVAAARARPGLVMDGRSLIRVAKRPGIERGRELLVEEPGFEAIRTERYMYAEHATGEEELYDLRRDRYQRQSRHADPAYASVKAELASRLHRLRRCAGAGCRHHP